MKTKKQDKPDKYFLAESWPTEGRPILSGFRTYADAICKCEEILSKSLNPCDFRLTDKDANEIPHSKWIKDAQEKQLSLMSAEGWGCLRKLKQYGYSCADIHLAYGTLKKEKTDDHKHDKT